jgi:hypothetical protein
LDEYLRNHRDENASYFLLLKALKNTTKYRPNYDKEKLVYQVGIFNFFLIKMDGG